LSSFSSSIPNDIRQNKKILKYLEETSYEKKCKYGFTENFSMLLIIIHHCVVFDLGLSNAKTLGDNTIILSAINSFCVIGVNLYWLILDIYI
jgi:hypothetical protein